MEHWRAVVQMHGQQLMVRRFGRYAGTHISQIGGRALAVTVSCRAPSTRKCDGNAPSLAGTEPRGGVQAAGQ